VSNPPDVAWLRDRASIVAGGVRAIVCLPLLDGGDLLGMLYADTDDAARVFDELDAELLGAFAEDVATWLAALALDARVAALGARIPQSPGGA
jgi:GAF domain-containing protein